VNSGFTTRINEVSKEESDAILRFLFDHCVRPEWTTRFRWEPHSIAFWDNRCAQHRAISDYLPHVRSGYRVQIEGTDAPVAG
jgi:taurine dioxygenase